MNTDVVQIFECPECHFRLEAPVRYAMAWCPRRHLNARKQQVQQVLEVIWDRTSGSPFPHVKKVRVKS